MLLTVGQIFLKETQWRWTLLAAAALILSTFQLCDGDYTLRAPSAHIALTSEVSVQYQVVHGAPTLSFGIVQLLDISDSTGVLRDAKPLPSTSSGSIYFDCSYFDHDGKFEFRILTETNGPVLAVSNTVNVYWPDVRIASPQIHLTALTSDVAVTIYTNAQLCSDMTHNRFETNVALMYHRGQRSPLTSNNLPTLEPSNGVLSEELPTGILGNEDQVQFYCNSVDRAGFYTFEYQSVFNRSVIAISSFVQVIWSDAYKVSSPQENIFPCSFDNGLEINYEYPSCRGENDKIRVFGQKYSFSRQPLPGTLEYITEEGAYDLRTVHFFCERFSLDYKGYCFKYVSVARSGAVDDHLMTCLPTNITGVPLNGAWSSWSSWGECTVSCGEGVQYRYRLCNNPSPVNGGASCLGETVDSQDCPYLLCPTGATVTFPNPDRGINVIPGCNCGCVLREINGTISSSPGSCTTGFGAWKVLVADGLRIKLDFRSFDLYLHDEWLRIRDGADENSRVLAYHTGSKLPTSIESSKNKLFLEYKVSGRETAHTRGFSAVYLTFENLHYNTPAAPIPAVDKVGTNDSSSVPLGSVTNFVLILGVFFCTFVIILSVACTGYAGWKRKKDRTTDGREDSGLTAGCRSSASGHSIEPTARGIAQSASSASELSNYSGKKRGCPDGRFVDRSSLYMVKDETGLTYLPESNLSSPSNSHADEGAKPMMTIPEVPLSPYTDQNDCVEEDLTKYEVSLPYHLGPGSVAEFSDRQTVKTDANTTHLARKLHDKHSSRGSVSVRGSQNSMYDSRATGTNRSYRSGSGSGSKFNNSDSSLSRRKGRDQDLRSPFDTHESELRVLEGSEESGHSSGARRKRKPPPSGSHNSHSNHSRNSHPSHNSHGTSHNNHNNGHSKRHHGHRSHRHSSDLNGTDSERRRSHDNVVYPEIGQRPAVAGESPTTQTPRKLPKPPRMAFHEQEKQFDKPSSVAENPHHSERSRHKNKNRHHSKSPPVSYNNEVFDISFDSANLGPRAPIWPGKSPSTEGASDTNSRGSRNSSNQNKIETTAEIETPYHDDAKPRKRGKHNKSRHKRDTKVSSAGNSAEDDPMTASRLAHYSNGSEHDKTDPSSESHHSDPSMSSPLHLSYLNNRPRIDYMKSVFISDESLARTHSGVDSVQPSRTTTPHMARRSLPATPPYSGLSSPSKSLTCVPIYSDGMSILDGYDFDDFYPNVPGAYFDNPTRLPLMSPAKKLVKPEKGEMEKSEIVKNGIEYVAQDPEEEKLSEVKVTNGTKPLAIRRTRPRRGPLSAASLV